MSQRLPCASGLTISTLLNLTVGYLSIRLPFCFCSMLAALPTMLIVPVGSDSGVSGNVTGMLYLSHKKSQLINNWLLLFDKNVVNFVQLTHHTFQMCHRFFRKLVLRIFLPCVTLALWLLQLSEPSSIIPCQRDQSAVVHHFPEPV